MLEKTHLRSKFKEERRTLDIAQISDDIVKNIRNSDFYAEAQNVLIFYPLRYEVNLLSLLDDNKNFYFPKVSGEKLLVCPYEQGCEFKKSCYNINEPCTNPVSNSVLDLIFVPALAVDVDNYRLGYGGGYYDRFLKECEAFSVVPICEKFLVEKLPRNEFDVAVNAVVTEHGKRLTFK